MSLIKISSLKFDGSLNSPFLIGKILKLSLVKSPTFFINIKDAITKPIPTA